MKKITVLVTYNSIIAAIGNTRYMFMMVNEFLKQSGKPEAFDIQLVGTTKEIELNEGLYTIKTDALLDEVNETDLIIIPPMSGRMENSMILNKEYISWIRQQYKTGAEVASLCVGAFLLAETGLLNGEKCSTHWKTANEFRRKFPKITLVDDKIITDKNGLYTSGGANSYWNLLIYLVRKFTNREISLQTSKYFEVELNRNTQSHFMIFEGCKNHNDEIISRAQKHIETNYQKKLTIDDLSKLANLSKRTFQRRFKSITHFTVTEYIQKVKIEAAKKLIDSHRLTINEIMYEVGYNDPKAFREVFKKNSGMTPLDYKNKFMDLVA